MQAAATVTGVKGSAYHSRRHSSPTVTLNTYLVLATVRTITGTNNAEDAGRMDTQIRFADALQQVFPTTVASYLRFRGWIHQETLRNRSSVTFDLRQCAL